MLYGYFSFLLSVYRNILKNPASCFLSFLAVCYLGYFIFFILVYSVYLLWPSSEAIKHIFFLLTHYPAIVSSMVEAPGEPVKVGSFFYIFPILTALTIGHEEGADSKIRKSLLLFAVYLIGVVLSFMAYAVNKMDLFHWSKVYPSGIDSKMLLLIFEYSGYSFFLCAFGICMLKKFRGAYQI